MCRVWVKGEGSFSDKRLNIVNLPMHKAEFVYSKDIEKVQLAIAIPDFLLSKRLPGAFSS